MQSECTCCKGKAKADQNSPPIWMLDSGVSLHFTFNMNDYIEYESLQEDIIVSTANSLAFAKGFGTVIMSCPITPGVRTVLEGSGGKAKA